MGLYLQEQELARNGHKERARIGKDKELKQRETVPKKDLVRTLEMKFWRIFFLQCTIF